MGATFSVMNDTGSNVWAVYCADGSEVQYEVGFTDFCQPMIDTDTWSGHPVTFNMTQNEFGDQCINLTVTGFSSTDDATTFMNQNIYNKIEAFIVLYPPNATLNSQPMSLSLPQHFWGVKVTVSSSSIVLERGYLAVTTGATDKSNNSYNMSSTNWSYSSR